MSHYQIDAHVLIVFEAEDERNLRSEALQAFRQQVASISDDHLASFVNYVRAVHGPRPEPGKGLDEKLRDCKTVGGLRTLTGRGTSRGISLMDSLRRQARKPHQARGQVAMHSPFAEFIVEFDTDRTRGREIDDECEVSIFRRWRNSDGDVEQERWN